LKATPKNLTSDSYLLEAGYEPPSMPVITDVAYAYVTKPVLRSGKVGLTKPVIRKQSGRLTKPVIRGKYEDKDYQVDSS